MLPGYRYYRYRYGCQPRCTPGLGPKQNTKSRLLSHHHHSSTRLPYHIPTLSHTLGPLPRHRTSRTRQSSQQGYCDKIRLRQTRRESGPCVRSGSNEMNSRRSNAPNWPTAQGISTPCCFQSKRIETSPGIVLPMDYLYKEPRRFAPANGCQTALK